MILKKIKKKIKKNFAIKIICKIVRPTKTEFWFKKQNFSLPTTNYQLPTNSGFVILIATLLGSLFLIIGVFIFNISIKELLLSSGGRGSQYAFYAANSGLDCALYWDIKGTDVFATSNSSSPSPSNVFCSGEDVTLNPNWVWKSPANSTSAETTFQLNIFPSDLKRNDCAIVTVRKNLGAVKIDTIIESRGYNTCDTANPRRVERGLKVSY